MGFGANVSYYGYIHPSPPLYSEMTITPRAWVGVRGGLDASVLFGLVEAGIDPHANISVSLPLQYVNGTRYPLPKCFRYQMWLDWYYSIGWCPFCYDDDGTRWLFDGATPSGCSNLLAAQGQSLTVPIPNQPPLRATPALAADGFGHQVRLVRRLNDGQLLAYMYTGEALVGTHQLTTLVPTGAPKVAYYAPDRAVAVWPSSDITSPAGWQGLSLNNAAQSQHMLYSAWDGGAWSAPQALTPAGSGEGSVALAGCLSTTPGCPTSGAVTAAWVRQVTGSVSFRRWRVFYSTYYNGAWTSPLNVEPDSGFWGTDAQPAVAWARQASGNRFPLLAWVRQAVPDLANTATRRIFTRRVGVDAAPADPGLPGAVAELALAADDSGRNWIGFTRILADGALLGDQHYLHAATQAGPGDGWTSTMLTDQGRAIKAEGPQLVVDGAGQANLVFRGLGYRLDANEHMPVYAGDPPGMVDGTGALGVIPLDVGTFQRKAHWVGDGVLAEYHQPAAAYDEASNTIVVGAVHAISAAADLQPAGGPNAALWRAEAAAFGLGGPQAPLATTWDLMQAVTPRLPDFIIVSAAVSATYNLPGGAVTATVVLGNQGADWAAGRNPALDLSAHWDAGPGLGLPAGSTTVAALRSGEQVTLSLPLTVSVDLLLPHTLYLTANASAGAAELTSANNQVTRTVGGLAVPISTTTTAGGGTGLVYLGWQPPADPRVAGYLVERSLDGRRWQLAGSTFGAGFVDQTASAGHTWHYRVRSYSAGGYRSEPAAAAPADVKLVPIGRPKLYLPMIRK